MSEITEPELKIEIKDDQKDVSDIIDEPPSKPKKERKKKKPMSEHHKKKCIESLKKAREASALKRKEKAEYKKIMKQKDDEEMKEIIRKSRAKDKEDNEEKDKIILRLQKQLNNLTLQDVIPKPKKKPKQMITIIEDEHEEPPSNQTKAPDPKPIEPNPAPIQKPKPMIQNNMAVNTNIISNKPKAYICKRKSKAFQYF